MLFSSIISSLPFKKMFLSSQDAPPLTNGLRKCGIYTHGILCSHEEE
jgi:hypothetical protein